MQKYVLPINEETLDLIEFLNVGVRPELEDETTCFVFEVNGRVIKNQDVVTEDSLYDEGGNRHDTDPHWLIG